MQDVARMLGVSVKTISRMILAGKLPATRVGGVYRIRLADVDDYLEKRRVVGRETEMETGTERAATEREAEVRLGLPQTEPEEKPRPEGEQGPRTCARCLRLLKGISPAGGRCQAPDCGAALCRACWANEQDRFCRDHALPREERLTLARQRLQRGEIPLLVTAEQAREREQQFIARFDLKIREKPYLISPLDGTSYPIESWGQMHAESSELDPGRLMGIRWAGVGPATAPRNPSSTYSWPPPGASRSARMGGRFAIAAIAFADLAEFTAQGFSVAPATRTRLWQFLEEREAAARAGEAFHVVGLGSPTGWTPDAREVVKGGAPSASSGQAPSRSFTSLYLSICLVDLHQGQVIYNALDKRLEPFVPLFRGELHSEVVVGIITWVQEALKSGASTLTDKEIAAGTGADASQVVEALKRLQEEGGYRVDRLPEYGLVVTRGT